MSFSNCCIALEAALCRFCRAASLSSCEAQIPCSMPGMTWRRIEFCANTVTTSAYLCKESYQEYYLHHQHIGHRSAAMYYLLIKDAFIIISSQFGTAVTI